MFIVKNRTKEAGAANIIRSQRDRRKPLTNVISFQVWRFLVLYFCGFAKILVKTCDSITFMICYATEDKPGEFAICYPKQHNRRRTLLISHTIMTLLPNGNTFSRSVFPDQKLEGYSLLDICNVLITYYRPLSLINPEPK